MCSRARMRWAVSGAHTASGKPLLSNDMHLEYSLPGIWYMTHLEAPGLDVSGVALPGAPGIIVGHNQRIAWGITNLGFDVQDLYIEQIDERTGRYVYQGQPEQARDGARNHPVKEAKPVEMQHLGHAARPDLCSRRQRRAWRCAGRPPNRACCSIRFSISTARRTGLSSTPRWPDFRGRARTSSTPMWTATSAITPRANCPCGAAFQEACPLDGASGKFEWDGFIPFAELPSVLQSAQRDCRHRQPEPVSLELHLQRGRQLRAAVSRAADPRPARGAPGMARRRT